MSFVCGVGFTFFFFKQKTAYEMRISDWSSDVCSSDLVESGRIEDHVIERQLIALDRGGERPVLGMFLGGAYLADVMLYCRHRIYPLGLPNGISHFLAAMLAFVSILFGLGGGRLPPKPEPMTVSLIRQGEFKGKFSLLIVTTLEKLLLSIRTSDRSGPAGNMKLLRSEERRDGKEGVSPCRSRVSP